MNILAVGDAYISPLSTRTSKYSDAEINDFIGVMPDGKAEIRFKCNGVKQFFKDCQWKATKGLTNAADPGSKVDPPGEVRG